MAARGWATSARATISTPHRGGVGRQQRPIKGHFQFTRTILGLGRVSPPILVDYKFKDKTVKGLVDVARDGYLWQL